MGFRLRLSCSKIPSSFSSYVLLKMRGLLMRAQYNSDAVTVGHTFSVTLERASSHYFVLSHAFNVKGFLLLSL